MCLTETFTFYLQIPLAILLSDFWVLWKPFAIAEVVFILIALDSCVQLTDFTHYPARSISTFFC